MKKNLTVIIACALTVVLVGLLYLQQSSRKSPGPAVIRKVPKEEPFLTVPLKTMDPKLNQQGTALFFDLGNGKVRVQVNANDIKLKDQILNIQQGSCQYPARIAYSLIPLRDGSSVTTITTSQKQLIQLKPWVVNLAHPAPDIAQSTACGEYK